MEERLAASGSTAGLKLLLDDNKKRIHLVINCKGRGQR
ncbi:hypothetical protein COLO4_31039 [Corchorus olitorius]|uniref:Uncharacterized protein n=1 Tax=Corchorus olitorius TaxID=93759 RepID=A0A1R3H5W8_9ROSI|nr:hypothetical protein COLO4_31039 [Corchorus olitorius]